MSIQIYSAIWPYILKCCAFKMLWIFLFVTVCISSFLMIMFKSRKEDLKKSVLPKDALENIHGKISDLKQDLRYKESKSKDTDKKIKIIKKPTFTTHQSASLRNLQKYLIKDLKRDVLKTEEELTELEYEISALSRRRESIKNEISKQQEEYNKCMQIFLND